MRKVTLLCLLPLIGHAVASTEAADLGQHGAVFEITELDMLTVIEMRLKMHEESGKLDQFNQKLQEEMVEVATNPKGTPGIFKASADAIRKFDPTVSLDDDIVIDGKVVHAKGTRINPLQFGPFQKLVFIDGSDSKHRSFANSIAAQDTNAIVILVNGKPGRPENSDASTPFYYFDQGGVYTKRFGITRVPSVVYRKGNEMVLTIQEVLLQENKSQEHKPSNSPT